MNFKKFLEDNLWDDFFKDIKEDNLWDDFFKDIKHSQVVKKDTSKVSDYVLELYRGFNLNLDELKKEGNYYILSPKKSEQGLIWFTHKFIVHYNPIEYAAGHGNYFLTYPLHCKKHTQTITWSDGHTTEQTPEEFQKKEVPTSNCRFYYGIELPEGWVFSYKMEKFIGCSQEIRITKDMIRKSSEVWNNEE